MSVANVRHSDAGRPRPATTVPAAPAIDSTRQQVLLAAGLAGLWALAVAAATLVPVDAHADRGARVERESAARRGPLAVEVRVGGRTTPLYLASNRADRWYLEAREGAKYEIRVRNTTGQRIGFVLAVDGLNAIDGTRSRHASNEPMYVLDPYQSSTIKGWRKSLSSVSRFVFVDEERSYAERTGQGNGELGWIRVTAFHEQNRGGAIRWRSDDGRDELRAHEEKAAPERDAAPGEGRSMGGMKQNFHGGDLAPAAPMAESNPGTGWGPNQRDRVRTVEFEPRPYAAAQVILRYEYKRELVALGILPWRAPDRTWERERGLYGFAQPPRGR